MEKQSITSIILLMAVLVVLSVGSAGCTSQTPASSPTPVTTKTLSSAEPSEMILQPSEIPGNFTLVAKGERPASQLSEWALAHGWTKGYYAVYQKNDPDSPSVTFIKQNISVYSAENITLVVPDTINGYKSWPAETNNTNLSVEEVSLPTIGDVSGSLRFFDKSDNSSGYLIAFVKKDVFQDIQTNGTAADYETAKQLAGIAAAKIK